MDFNRITETYSNAIRKSLTEGNLEKALSLAAEACRHAGFEFDDSIGKFSSRMCALLDISSAEAGRARATGVTSLVDLARLSYSKRVRSSAAPEPEDTREPVTERAPSSLEAIVGALQLDEAEVRVPLGTLLTLLKIAADSGVDVAKFDLRGKGPRIRH